MAPPIVGNRLHHDWGLVAILTFDTLPKSNTSIHVPMQMLPLRDSSCSHSWHSRTTEKSLTHNARKYLMLSSVGGFCHSQLRVAACTTLVASAGLSAQSHAHAAYRAVHSICMQGSTFGLHTWQYRGSGSKEPACVSTKGLVAD